MFSQGAYRKRCRCVRERRGKRGGSELGGAMSVCVPFGFRPLFRKQRPIVKSTTMSMMHCNLHHYPRYPGTPGYPVPVNGYENLACTLRT
eukprot:3756529-Rhodomonas_salina.2